MRAVVRHEYGDTSVLGVEEIDEPEAEPGTVVVEVAAAGVNMAECCSMMSGEPTMMRLVTGLRRPKRPGLGQDVAGIVASVGPGVESFAVGDHVFGSARASWPLASASADLLQPVPPGVSLTQAAAVPMPGYTALQALRGRRSLSREEHRDHWGGWRRRVVCSAARRETRRARHAICSASKATFVRDLGAHDVVNYATTDPTSRSQRFDAVLDFAGGLPLSHWRRVITPGGTLVLGGSEGVGVCSAQWVDHSGHPSREASRRLPSWLRPEVKISPSLASALARRAALYRFANLHIRPSRRGDRSCRRRGPRREDRTDTLSGDGDARGQQIVQLIESAYARAGGPVASILTLEE